MKIRKETMLPPPPAKTNNCGWVTFAVIAVLAIIFGFGLSACDEGGGGTSNPCAKSHDYPAWTAPTCTVAGNSERTCTRCGNADTRTSGFAAFGHDWDYVEDDALVIPTCEAAGHGSRECTRIGCGEVEDDVDFDALGHNWNNWHTTKIPNCVETGEKQRECQRIECGILIENELPIDEDGHDIIVVDGVAPTCLTDGHGTIKCDRDSCDYTKTGDVLKATNHNFAENWEVITAATCSAAGTEERFCTHECGETNNRQERTIAILDCEYYHWVEVNASNITDLHNVEIQSRTCKHNESHYEISTEPLTEYIKLKAEVGLEPVALKISIELSTGSGAMTVSNSGWMQLRSILAAAGKPVTLDLSDSTFGTNKAFNTGTENIYPRPGLNNIVSIVLPNTAVSINANAFRSSSRLTNVTIPDSVTEIGNNIFDGCSSLTSITLPVTGTGFFSRLFTNVSGTTNQVMESLKTVTLTSGSIPANYFDGCTGLTSITIGADVTSIGQNAFLRCSSLTSITIGAGVTSIGFNAFSGCSGLTSITIDAGVTSIGNTAFRDCSNLTSITIPDSVTSIGGGAFSGCSGLTSIKFGKSVVTIGNTAFSGCTNLINIIVDEDNIEFSSLDGILYNKTKTAVIRCPLGISGKITLPDNVQSIGSDAFTSCDKLTEIIIPDSVTSIGNSAFSNCNSLESITLPIIGSVFVNIFGTIPTSLKTVIIIKGTSIPGKYFSGFRSLTSITIPDSVTSIGGGGNSGDGAFSGCSNLTSITIPDSVTSIGYNAFSGCSNLESITLPRGNINHIFGGPSSISGPSFLKTVVLTNATSIPDSSFNNCTGLTSITIPDSVTSIGSYAFQNCNSLTSITIPENVTSIGQSAFYGCSSLTSVDFNSVISEANFNSYTTLPVFPGDLRAKYLAASGGIGTYTRPSGSSNTWTKQP